MDSEAMNGRAPHWDLSRRELVIDGHVVKRFREPAPTEEARAGGLRGGSMAGKNFRPAPPERRHETEEALARNNRGPQPGPSLPQTDPFPR